MTTLYLVRHGATAANLSVPYKLQGRRLDPTLAPVGVRQAEAARDFLKPFDFTAVYTSPLKRAAETARIIAAPRRLTPKCVDALTECDLGTWDGLDWDTIRAMDGEYFRTYSADPATVPAPGGESFEQVHERVTVALRQITSAHPNSCILVVSHHVVLRTFLAVRLGLPLKHTRRISLENGGVSVVKVDGKLETVTTLNAAFHLPAKAA